MKNINVNELKKMFEIGTQNIAANFEYINELNVFPVPDGDTGTNMKITTVNAYKEVSSMNTTDIHTFGQAFSRSLLMNARGNSGVIFSQIIKGFVSKFKSESSSVDIETLIKCFESAKITAYEAVSRPVEGTILTIIRRVAEELANSDGKFKNVIDVFQLVCDVAKVALDDTPNLLPELKKVGVVDSGGYGLWCFLTGMYESLTGIKVKLENKTKSLEAQKEIFEHETLDTDDNDNEIGFGYCSEIIMKLNSQISPDDKAKLPFYLEEFKEELSKFGNSLVCVQDTNLVKVHLHTTTPWKLLSTAQKYGEFLKVKIENMTEQFYAKLQKEGLKIVNPSISKNNDKLSNKPQIVITCPSAKIKRILTKEYGFKYILNTENSGNPSIQEILTMIQNTKSKNVLIITDDTNIVMAANQAAGILKENIDVRIIKGSNIYEALLAALEFDKNANLDINEKQMSKVVKNAISALISQSIKDVNYSYISFNKNDYIGIIDKQIEVADPDELTILKKTIDVLMSKVKHADVCFIFYDKKIKLPLLKEFETYVREKYNLFCEFKDGGQKVYNYFLGLQ